MIVYFLLAVSILLTGISQVFLKIGAQKKGNIYSIYLNIFTIFGYVLLIVVTVSNVVILRELDLKLLYAIMSLNYVIVIIFSKVLLKEFISHNKWMAIILIVAGVIAFNL